jgi:hypothetical protein
MNKADRNKKIDKAYRKGVFANILPILKVCGPVLLLIVGVIVFFKFDATVDTGKTIEGIVIERTKSTYGYRQIDTVDVVKVRLSNGAVVVYERSDLHEGDKVVYEIYKGKYTGREKYEPRPASSVPIN